MNWIEVPPKKYTIIPAGKEKKSNCQLEISVK
jgi:hypothetical protein